MAIKVEHLNGLKFGAGGFSATHTGLQEVTEVSLKKELTIEVPAVNGDGDTIGALVGGEKHTVSVTGYSSVVDAPDLGSQISCGGISGADVVRAEVTASQSDFAKIRLEAEKYPNIQS
jgi:hypothetical protein